MKRTKTIQRFDESSWCCGAQVTETGFCRDCFDKAEPRHELIYCDHARAVETEFDASYPDTNVGDLVEHQRLGEVCAEPNCGAYHYYGDTDWRNAPWEGEHHA